MHHAKEAHKFAKPPSHAFVLPRDGEPAELLRQAFPEAYFDEKDLEWRVGRLRYAFEGFAAAIALDFHFQDCGVMDEAINGRERHGLVREASRSPPASPSLAAPSPAPASGYRR